MVFYPSVREHVLAVDAEAVNVFESEPEGAGHTIVLCHGTGGSAESNFWALFPMLAMRHRVVAFDFVDMGRDDGYLDQALAVLDSYGGNGPAHLLGYSFGAVIAAQAAAAAPKQIASLTLVAGWLKTDAQQLLRNDIWRSLHDSDHPALAPFSVFAQYSPQYLNSRLDHELAAEIEGVRRGRDRSAKMRFNRSVEITAQAAAIAAPTLVIGCRHDQVTPLRHSQLLFGAIPDARLAVVDAGHGVLTERPSEVFTLVDDFLTAPQAAPAGSVIDNVHA